MARRTDTVTDPVLAAARELTTTIRSAEAQRFQLAATWAAMHPAPVTDPAVTADGLLAMYGDQPVTLAGEGAPGMSEFAIAEFAAAIGISTHAGRDLIGAALECQHRLPKIWARIMRGEVPVWKARRVTDHTHRLPLAGAAYLDTHLAPVLATCSFAQIERAVEAAVAETDDEKTEMDRLDAAAGEYVEVRLADAHLNNGRVALAGLLDYPVALAFEKFLQTTAHDLRATHPDLSLDQRRVLALGLLGHNTTAGTSGVAEVVVYTHHTPTDPHGIVGVEGLSHTTIEQLGDWCRTIATKVTIRPVLDLTEEITTPGYQPTDRQREHVILTNPTCVFPHCARSSRRCDLDHITPYDTGGTTTTANLAPLCRLHHRMKTHGHWTYTRHTPTHFEWTSPTGQTYDVDHTHTRRRTR
jgi:hypothetical protein